MKADALTDALIKLGTDTNWEVDLIEDINGTILIVDIDKSMVLGTVVEPGDVIMFATARSMADYRLKEDL